MLELQVVPAGSEDEEKYDSPHGSEWIVAVDIDGNVSILKRPNLHYSFFDNGSSAEHCAIPFELSATEPGVYGWVCDFVESRDWETGLVDDWHFEVRDEVCLYRLPSEGS